jgi:hypothetical protein
MTTRRVIIIEDDYVIEATADYFIASDAAGRGHKAWAATLERLSAR